MRILLRSEPNTSTRDAILLIFFEIKTVRKLSPAQLEFVIYVMKLLQLLLVTGRHCVGLQFSRCGPSSGWLLFSQ